MKEEFRGKIRWKWRIDEVYQPEMAQLNHFDIPPINFIPPLFLHCHFLYEIECRFI